MYIRYVVNEYNVRTKSEMGLFGAVTNLAESNSLTKGQLADLEKYLKWFSKNLKKPHNLCCPETGVFGTCWFKANATEHLQVMEEFTKFASKLGLTVIVLQEVDGVFTKVLYEDDHQIVTLSQHNLLSRTL